MTWTAATCCRIAAFAAILAGSGGFASAQTERTYRGIFGAPVSSTGANSSVTLLFGEAYDSNFAAEVAGAPQLAAVGGGFSTAGADLALTVRAGARTLAVTAGTDVRYYHDQQQVVGTGHHAGIGLTLTSHRTTFTVSEAVAYTPSYLFRVLPTDAPALPGQVAVGRDYIASDERSYNYLTSIELTRTISPRSTLSFHASGGYAKFVGGDPLRGDTWSVDAGGSFGRQLSRHARLRSGYTIRQYRLIGARPVEHGIDVGLEVDRPASQTRGTRISIGVGTALLKGAPAAPQGTGTASRRITSEAAVVRQFSRTWEMRGIYRRGIDYLDGFATTVASDGVSLSTEGLLSRRADLVLLAAYSRGQAMTPLRPNDRLTIRTGSARVRFAMNSVLAVYGEYFYYGYDLPAEMLLVAGGPSRLARHGVRTGIVSWFPLGRH